MAKKRRRFRTVDMDRVTDEQLLGANVAGHVLRQTEGKEVHAFFFLALAWGDEGGECHSNFALRPDVPVQALAKALRSAADALERYTDADGVFHPARWREDLPEPPNGDGA